LNFFTLIRMPNFSNQVCSSYVSTLVFRTYNLLLIGNKIKRSEIWKKGRNEKFYCWCDGKSWIQRRIRFEVEIAGAGSGTKFAMIFHHFLLFLKAIRPDPEDTFLH
jgi:hypothetical protein